MLPYHGVAPYRAYSHTNHLAKKVRLQKNSVSVLTRSFSKLQLTDKEVRAPKTVDFNVNGICNLNCHWCWGPDHKAKEELTNDQWKEIAGKLHALGTQNITFTGGEPLMKEGLADLLKYVQGLGVRTTLSTNGLLLRRLGTQVLPYVNDIGLPLDGHTQAINSSMREGSPKHFERVLEAIVRVQKEYPKIDLTVRTVLSKKNEESVPLIGKTLRDFGVDPTKIRWKIYQVTPTGIRKSDTIQQDWCVLDKTFDEVVEQTKKANPEFAAISTLKTEGHAGRYFHIYPDGKSHIFIDGADGLPAPFPLGNIGAHFDVVLANLQAHTLSGNQIR